MFVRIAHELKPGFLMYRLIILTLTLGLLGCRPSEPITERQESKTNEVLAEENSEPQNLEPSVARPTAQVVSGEQHAATAQAIAEKAAAQQQKFYTLGRRAKEAFKDGKTDEARENAEELLKLIPLPRFQHDWNYGNAVQDANLVLGRIAVQEDRLEDARQFLKKSAASAGSPQMNSFGPNMSLAKDLLEKGERDAVLEYFEACRKFWKMERGQLDKWSQQVKDGAVPDFGANLLY